MAQRVQQETTACAGLSASDACSITSTNASRPAMQGTCQDQNGTLLCIPAGFGNGSYAGRTGGYPGGGYAPQQG